MEPLSTGSPIGFHFDPEVAGHLQNRLSQLQDRVREIQRLLSESQPCEAVQVSALRLREEASALAVEVVQAHMETCIAQSVRAGESTAALTSLKVALGRLLQHL